MAVSIKDVAARAGVSTATVSHVLNQTRNTKPATRQRVLEAVAELGYSQNLSARNLAVGRSSLLGLILSDIRNPFFPEITSAFQDQALLHHMEALVLNTNYDTQRTLDSVKRLVGLQVPGVAVVTSQVDPSISAMLQERKIAAVYLDLGRVDRYISNITVQYEQGIAEALEHLASLGHRRIGFLGGPAHLPSSGRRKQAFLDSARQLGIEPCGPVTSDFTVKGGYYACSKLLSSSRPTAIVGGNDLTAIGALHCAFDRGLRVPDELSVVGFDDITFAEYTQPALTTVLIPRLDIGRTAFQALWHMISSGDSEGREYPVATRLIVRQSTAPAPKP
ncbi:MAG: LacI family DNA-binding transcriptional regulator [Bryobacterales bacterium]|nr:LacI family DNA-binding transcriptional regulator [Bryobacterales bacterium]